VAGVPSGLISFVLGRYLRQVGTWEEAGPDEAEELSDGR
jgi:hypothetical protein